MILLGYSKCSTSQKAKKWLKDHQIIFDTRSIKDENPSFDELKQWHEQSGLSINKFFNTSGRLYREQGIKDIIKTATLDELLSILASDGMLVKRPLLISDDFVLVGFNEDSWKKAFKLS